MYLRWVSMSAYLKKAESFLTALLNKTIEFIERYYKVFFVMFCAVITLLCFLNLGKWPVLDWDEARHGVSAYEMIKNKNFLVNTFNYKVDYWNLKPVLSFSAIIFCFKLFGYSIFSLRLYSALSMVATAICVGVFTYKRFGKLASLCTLAFMCSCTPLYLTHCARNGDADAMFLLFFSLSVMLVTTKRYFWCSGLFFALAFLTKSWHAGCAFIIILAYIIYLIIKKQLPCKKQLIGFVVSMITPVLVWAIARYFADGWVFFKGMFLYDLLKRSTEGVENHAYGFFLYFEYLFSNMTFLLIGFIGLLITYILIFKRQFLNILKQRNILFLITWTAVPFAIFCASTTKLHWYIFPAIFPILIGGGVMLAKLVKSKKVKVYLKLLFIVWFAFFVCRYSARLVNRFAHPPVDSLQSFISVNAPKIEGKSTYFEEIDSNGEQVTAWSQSAIFVAEINGNLLCKDGGVEQFFAKNQSETAVIMDLETFNLYDFSNNEKYTVCAADDEFIIVLLN